MELLLITVRKREVLVVVQTQMVHQVIMDLVLAVVVFLLLHKAINRSRD